MNPEHSQNEKLESLLKKVQKEAAELGLTNDEASTLLQEIKRLPSREELAVTGALWSEHCSYKSSRRHLRRFHTQEDWVLQGPGENAGVYAVNKLWAVAFKMESHNHPSYIEPYQGAATGVGGILRDVFCMGARPVANHNCLRFGEGPWNAHLLKRVTEGIADYGNSIGVPTVGGDTQFHPQYSRNILVNAFTAGVIRSDRIFKGVLTEQKPSHRVDWPPQGQTGAKLSKELRTQLFPPGENVLIYFGSATGRDGVHGATMSSASFSQDSQSLKPTVQVGDPFAEKVLLEATMALIDSGTMIGLQDMGAAGLTSSSAEMAGRSGCGVALDLSQVPLRARGMKAWEILLSESQERMLCAVKPENVQQVEKILQSFEIPYSVIGCVNATGRFVCTFQDQICVDLPCGLLTDGAPEYEWPLADRKAYLEQHASIENPTQSACRKGSSHSAAQETSVTLGLTAEQEIEALDLSKQIESGACLGDLLESPSNRALIASTLMLPQFCGRAPLFEHYCATVGGESVAAAGSFQEAAASVVRLPPEAQEGASSQGIAIASGCQERWVELDPLQGAAHSAASIARKIWATGGIPRAMTDCLNFGNPRDPIVMRQISDAIDGLNLIAKEHRIPVVSGNVSLNNQTDGHPIPPTPMIGVVGDIANVRNITPANLRHHVFRAEFDTPAPPSELALVALLPSQPNQHTSYLISELAFIWKRANCGPVPRYSAEEETRLLERLQLLRCSGNLLACRPVGRGGLLMTSLRCALESGWDWEVSPEFLQLTASQACGEGLSGYLAVVPTNAPVLSTKDADLLHCGTLLQRHSKSHPNMLNLAGLEINQRQWERNLDPYFRHDAHQHLTGEC